MLKITKYTFYEAIIIVFVATIFALIFNMCRDDGVPFMLKPKEDRLVTNDDLFSKINNAQPNTESQLPNKDTLIDTTEILSTIDTIADKTEDTTTTSTIIKEEISVEDVIKNSRKSLNDNFQLITIDQFRKIVTDYRNDFVLVDARNPPDFDEENIPTSINISPYEHELDILRKINSLPEDKTIVVWCDGGNCDSSHMIAELIKAAGYNNIYVFEGGWEEWKSNSTITK